MARRAAEYAGSQQGGGGSADPLFGRPGITSRLGVAFLVVTLLASASATPAAAQFASVAVTAQVVAPYEPAVVAAESLPLAAFNAPADTGVWTHHGHPDRPFVTRFRLRREPRTGSAGAGLVLEVVMDYPGI